MLMDNLLASCRVLHQVIPGVIYELLCLDISDESVFSLLKVKNRA